MQTLSMETLINNMGNYSANQDVFNKIGGGQEGAKEIKQDSEFVPAIKEKMLIKTIEKANKKLMGESLELNISIHEKTKQILVKIVDKSTKEIVKEIPSEKILDMVASMCEAAGLFVDKKV